jgi:hypothetical protein
VNGAPEQLVDLVNVINRMKSITAKNKKTLLAKLSAAQTAVTSGQTATACARLSEFVSLVNSFKVGKQFTASDANFLIGEATRIKAVLACP